MNATYFLHHRRKLYPVQSFAEASVIYSDKREASGMGNSTFPNGTITHNGEVVARVSYNGRVWEPGDWKPGMAPLFDPYESEGSR